MTSRSFSYTVVHPTEPYSAAGNVAARSARRALAAVPAAAFGPCMSPDDAARICRESVVRISAPDGKLLASSCPPGYTPDWQPAPAAPQDAQLTVTLTVGQAQALLAGSLAYLADAPCSQGYIPSGLAAGHAAAKTRLREQLDPLIPEHQRHAW